MIGKTLYLPVEVVIRPPTIETTIIASSIGRSRNPELVAEAPWTVCWNSGRKVIEPNIVKPTRKEIPEISEKLRAAEDPQRQHRLGGARLGVEETGQRQETERPEPDDHRGAPGVLGAAPGRQQHQ